MEIAYIRKYSRRVFTNGINQQLKWATLFSAAILDAAPQDRFLLVSPFKISHAIAFDIYIPRKRSLLSMHKRSLSWPEMTSEIKRDRREVWLNQPEKLPFDFFFLPLLYISIDQIGGVCVCVCACMRACVYMRACIRVYIIYVTLKIFHISHYFPLIRLVSNYNIFFPLLTSDILSKFMLFDMQDNQNANGILSKYYCVIFTVV